MYPKFNYSISPETISSHICVIITVRFASLSRWEMRHKLLKQIITDSDEVHMEHSNIYKNHNEK